MKISTEWQDSEWEKFRHWLINTLQVCPVTVTFTKTDGTERVMKCTLQPNLLPAVVIKENEAKRERKHNNNVLAVYDINAKGWRSFVLRNVTKVTISMTEDVE